MTARTPTSIGNLYDRDYVLWTEKTAEQLRRRDFDALDLENLIEEIESMGRSERQTVESLLTRLIEHLLKLTYWESERERNARHWMGEIANFRNQLLKKIKTATLDNHAREFFNEAYADAREILIDAGYIGEETVPVEPTFSLDQALTRRWFPIDTELFSEKR